MNWLKLLQYLPFVIQAVVAVETVYRNAPGAAKRQVVVESVIAVTKIAEGAPDVSVAQIGALTDNVVSSLNASGLFSKNATAQPLAAKV